SEPPENILGVAVRLTPDEGAWRAELAENEADLRTEVDGAFVLTRETAFGLAHDPRGVDSLALLGVRVVRMDGVDYASHVVARVTSGIASVGRATPLVLPISAMILGAYVERGPRAEAELDLRLTSAQVAATPAYMPDTALGRHVGHALDQAVLLPTARHAIIFEIMAGRVSLYGRAEFGGIGEEARAALAQTPGVIDIDDHIVYTDQLKEQVEQALSEKGIEGIAVLSEHGLVTLAGVVPDSKTKFKAKDTAAGIPGVRGVVITDLTVADSAAV
ncbi:MAG: BON domain-containing protein, partial [Ktedonobacterales bacterium]